MEIQKPNVDEEKAIAVYNYLANKTDNNGICTKREICWRVFGWTYNKSNDRKVRILLSLVANKYPLISLSGSKGYKLAKTREDLILVVRQWKENDSRIRAISDRKNPLIEFYNKFHLEN